MMNFLLFLMLAINPAIQSDSLFVASDSLFDSNCIIYLGAREGGVFPLAMICPPV